MDRHKALDCFDFNDNFFFNHQIQTITTIEFHLPVNYRQWFFSFHMQTTIGNFKSQTSRISGLQQTRAKRSMHLYRRTYDNFCNSI